jgi:phosphopantetheinyl transferase (holo-ACP synthase)
MKLKLISALILTSVCSISNSQGISSSIIAPVSPIMSVISITKFFVEVIGNQVPEYLVKIRVTDYDQQLATKLAFKEACNKAFGSVISSELESNNQQLTRDNVTNYSSCYVKDHKIISREQNGNGEFILEIDVTVSSNKIANRALGSSSATNQLDGEKHIDRIVTFQESKQDEDKILNSVLQDYPSRAFNLEIDGSRSMVNNYRNGRIEIDFIAGMNQGYLDSLQEVFKTVGKVPRLNPIDQRPTDSGMAQVSVLSESHSFFFGANQTKYYQFSDLVSYGAIQNRLGAPMNLLIQVRVQSGNWSNFACTSAPFNNPQAQPNLVTFGYNYTGIINARKKLQYTLAINITSQSVANYIGRISDIRLTPTLENCPMDNLLGTKASFV